MGAGVVELRNHADRAKVEVTMSRSEKQPDDLTGVWSGVYKQTPLGSVPFTATLIQSGDYVGGSTHEACSREHCPLKTHLAILSGHRSGRSIAFLKTYDPPGFGFGTVKYIGELNADATEIAGVWSIGSVSFGAFVMTRAGRRTAAEEDAELTIMK
jgi:hypothetical protein